MEEIEIDAWKLLNDDDDEDEDEDEDENEWKLLPC